MQPLIYVQLKTVLSEQNGGVPENIRNNGGELAELLVPSQYSGGGKSAGHTL